MGDNHNNKGDRTLKRRKTKRIIQVDRIEFYISKLK